MTLKTTTTDAGDQESAYRAEHPDFPVSRPDYSEDPFQPSRAARRRRRMSLVYGLGFLGPNILGFLTFTAVPLVIAMYMAFTNWDLALHNNPEGAEPLRFVGLDHFKRLFGLANFWRYLGNTLFFMMGMPFAIAGSLMAAMLLSKDLTGGHRHVWLTLIAGAVLVGSVLMLVAAGAAGTGMAMLIAGLAGGVLISGAIGGTTIYRTLFYVPHFTSGVATYLLWKKLFVPDTGPIAAAIQPVLNRVEGTVNASPSWLVQLGFAACVALALWLMWLALGRLRRYWEDGDLGHAGAILSTMFLLIPFACVLNWYGFGSGAYGWATVTLTLGALMVLGAQATLAARADKQFVVQGQPWLGVGTGLMFAVAIMVAIFVLVGLGPVFYSLPAWSATSDGLRTPNWLNDLHWAKPALMLMGFWGAIGSNNMLLYLAALTNVPQELYEAADIDGASRFQRFWSVTWPQLAPTTFFIVVMGVIGGLQGGFEMARVMTNGGPAGATTTLAYFIYQEGFETGRLGFSSAVAWALFLMVFIVTLFNWKFGNKYVND